MSRLGLDFLLLVSLFVSTFLLNVDADNFIEVKQAKFTDPNTGYLHRIVSYNATSITTESTHRSFIKVSRIKLNEVTRQPIGEPENIQTINFHPTLIDFDIHCQPKHCYLVAVTSRSKRNVELYSWQRTQFDLSAKRDSFARPHSLRLFKIRSAFYIAIAQEQLHLSPYKFNQDYEEPNRFIGCAIFRFTQSHESSLKYHQFIRLPFNPLYVYHFKNYVELQQGKRTENNYLVFSVTPNWHEPGGIQAAHFKWSPLNDYFWPYRLPRNINVSRPKGQRYPILKFPSIHQQQPQNLTLKQQPNQSDNLIEHVELCFNQLQRIITDRELYARKLIDTSRSLWRSTPQVNGMFASRPSGLTNISAQVIVRGNVIVRGSLIESPQITLIGHQRPTEYINVTQLSKVVDNHSPAIVENQLKQANYKLRHVRDKLARAVTMDFAPNSTLLFNSRIRFFGNIQAQRVSFRGSGIANSNVRLNGLPFNQLEHELVSLNGVQDIAAKVIFQGRVVADKLEIHGRINGAYYLSDAVDITSDRVQVIGGNYYNISTSSPGTPLVDFNYVSAPEVILAHNTTFNGVKLDNFVTRDSRTQTIFGKKSFRQLSMARLDLAHPYVPLNGFNLSNLASNSLFLRNPNGRSYQHINANHLTFSKSVTVKKLTVNNLINRYINVSSLIHDSVKAFEIVPQQISGHKNFLQMLKITHLTTEGSINGIQMNQVFNLNPNPPTPDYLTRYNNYSILGDFIFEGPVNIFGNLNAGSVNGVDISKRAIRRVPMQYDSTNQSISVIPQIVRGRKIFSKPLRVTNQIRLLDQPQLMSVLNTTRVPYPMVNGIDLRLINFNIKKQMQNPPVIYIDNLEIDGNLYLKTSWNQTSGPPAVTLGNHTICPLDVFQTKTILSGATNQHIDIPIRVNTLRARSIHSDPGALNGMNFPNDFVLKSAPSNLNYSSRPRGEQVELVFGHKAFQHLVVSPPLTSQTNMFYSSGFMNGGNPTNKLEQSVFLGNASSINNISFNELQTFIDNERRKNSTGETVLQTLNVQGNIYAKRINGHIWPEDILLKSVGSNSMPAPSPYVHRRIYSPLIFMNSSDLEVENQLVLRGPIQLGGRLNGVNLTEFARQSATYGDKDLLSSGRPITNKIFIGGLTVKGQIRSQGLIDSVDFDEMRRRVVVLGPRGRRVHIQSPKVFMSDVDFHAPVNMLYLNEFPLDQYLRRVQLPKNGSYIPIHSKKIITGTLKINSNLFVQGLINKIDFMDLKARAIPLSGGDRIQFNKTLTIEGDVFMDNLLIDEKDGIIDGVKLTNLIPIETLRKNEMIISEPILNTTQGSDMKLDGSINECKITCSLSPPRPTYPLALNVTKINYSPLPPPSTYRLPQPQFFQGAPQYSLPQPPTVSYTSRPVYYNGNVTYMRTTPPYVSTGYYNSPQQVPRLAPPPPPPKPISTSVIYADQRKNIQSLALRRPIAIHYEKPQPPKRYIDSGGNSQVVRQQLDSLRNQIVSLNLIRLSESSDLVIGFIGSSSDDISNLDLPELEEPHSSHAIYPKPFLVLDQIDFPFRPTIYHLSVGVATNQQGLNITSIFSSFGGSDLQQLSVLPIESPNNAKFLTIFDRQTLFLLVSQDYTTPSAQCPRYINTQSASLSMDHYNNWQTVDNQVKMGGIHVYLFHALQNSSSLANSYFDLYQTIDLPAIDSFENFEYHGSSYVLAISRATSRVYLMILRGYSGFQVVSYIDAPMVESVRLMYAKDSRPMLIIFQSNGLHRLMESVII